MMNKILVFTVLVASTTAFAQSGSVHTSNDPVPTTKTPADLVRTNQKLAELGKAKSEITSAMSALEKTTIESQKKFSQCQLQLDSVRKFHAGTFGSRSLQKLQDEFEKVATLVNSKASMISHIVAKLSDTEARVREEKMDLVRGLASSLTPKQRAFEINSFEQLVSETTASIQQNKNLIEQAKVAVKSDQKRLETICSQSQTFAALSINK